LVAGAGIIVSIYAKLAYQRKRWPFRVAGVRDAQRIGRS
jgi:hypothetical protein